ncbi:hypothetical protein BDY19DRAFT_988281 [Irpex rosettiformis]|uniref:Uncharacterized protein n=1 Tax=Irpex rosettiformis TaxID=378272 RepID=A0ACB8UK44_9APHY|nr:hypothetical protein BDY19DRAFT_988281 [Irpex rosettiformis]
MNTNTHSPLRLMDLPDEVHLAIQSHMTLTTLLTARAVCRLWNSTIPGSHIPSPRLRLLNLYLRLVHSPAFHATRKDTLKRLEPFDRTRALGMAGKGSVEIPDEFRLWLLEWPERAAFGGIWPGLRTLLDIDTDAAHSTTFKAPGRSLIHSRADFILQHLDVSVSCDAEGNPLTEMQVSPPWASVPPAKRAVALVLDDTYVNGWQRSNMLVLSAPATSKELIGRVYQVDGTHVRSDAQFVPGWVDFLQGVLEGEERWMAGGGQRGLDA